MADHRNDEQRNQSDRLVLLVHIVCMVLLQKPAWLTFESALFSCRRLIDGI